MILIIYSMFRVLIDYINLDHLKCKQKVNKTERVLVLQIMKNNDNVAAVEIPVS